MAALMKSLLIRIALCAGATAACYFILISIFGSFGQSSEKTALWAMALAASSVIWGVALARPLVEMASAAYNGLRWLVWRKEQGRWYEYDGRRLRVFTLEGAPWIAVRDIAAAMAWENLEQRCGRMPPEQCRVVEDENLLCLSESGIQALFAKRTEPQALRFGLWLERNVLIQFRLAQQRGLRLPRT